MKTALDQYITHYDTHTRFVRTHQVAGAAAVVLGLALGALAYLALSQGVIPGLESYGLAGTITASALTGYTLLSAGVIATLASYLLRVGKKRDRISHEALLCALSNRTSFPTQEFQRVLSRWSNKECQEFMDYIQLHCQSEPFASVKQQILNEYRSGLGKERYETLEKKNVTGISMKKYLKNYQAEYRHRKWHAYSYMAFPIVTTIAIFTILFIGGILPHAGLSINCALLASGSYCVLTAGAVTLMLSYLITEKRKKERCNFDQFLVALTLPNAQEELLSIPFRDHPLSYNKQAILDYIEQKYPKNKEMRAIVESYTSMVF